MADPIQLEVNTTVDVTAEFRDALGGEVITEGDGALPVTWETNAHSVRVLIPDSTKPSHAQIFGVSVGNPTVSAVCGGVTASVEVTVIQKGMPVVGDILAASGGTQPARKTDKSNNKVTHKSDDKVADKPGPAT